MAFISDSSKVSKNSDVLSLGDNVILNSTIAGVDKKVTNVDVINSEVLNSDVEGYNDVRGDVPSISDSQIEESRIEFKDTRRHDPQFRDDPDTITNSKIVDSDLKNATVDNSKLFQTVVINSKVTNLDLAGNQYGRPVVANTNLDDKYTPFEGVKLAGPIEFYKTKGLNSSDASIMNSRLRNAGVDKIEVNEPTSVRNMREMQSLVNNAIEKQQNVNQDFNLDGLDSVKSQEL